MSYFKDADRIKITYLFCIISYHYRKNSPVRNINSHIQNLKATAYTSFFHGLVPMFNSSHLTGHRPTFCFRTASKRHGLGCFVDNMDGINMSSTIIHAPHTHTHQHVQRRAAAEIKNICSKSGCALSLFRRYASHKLFTDNVFICLST